MPGIDHKTIIGSLNPDIRKALLARSDVAGLKQAGFHFGLILISGLYIHLSLPLWQCVLVIHGIFLIFLFTALHESIHDTAFQSPWMNLWISQVCGFVVFLPPRWFRQFHFAHHRHTNIPGLDPELATPKPQSLFEYCNYLSGFPVWVFHFKTLFINASGENANTYVPKNKLTVITNESRGFLFGYFLLAIISLYFKSTALIWLWLVPVTVGQPFLRAYLLAEHTLCPQVTNMLVNSRTTLTTSFIKMIAWNMPYHAEHHSLPSVPFYKLPLFHQHLKDHLKEIENGYSEFHKKLLKQIRQSSNS